MEAVSEMRFSGVVDLDIVPRSRGKKFHIIGHQCGGFGDVAAAFKVARIAVELGIPQSDILVTVIDCKPSDIALFNSDPTFEIAALPELKDSFRACILFTPSFSDRAFMAIAKGISWRDPVYYFSEYGSRALRNDEFPLMKYHPMGISRHMEASSGILISRELVDFARGSESSNSLNRLMHLLDAGICLKQKITGKEVPTIQDIEIMNETACLYFGYVHRLGSALAYIAAIGVINARKTHSKNIIIMLPMEPFKFDNLNLNPIFSETLKSLKAVGIGTLVITLIGESSSKSIIIDAALNKVVTLILGNVSSRDLCTLIKSSEPEVVTTGDQSFSEVVSAAKHFCYETLSHKSLFAYDIQSLFDDLCVKESDRISITFDGEILGDLSQFHLAIGLLVNAFSNDSHLSYTRFHGEIVEKSNFSLQIKGLLSSVLESS